MSAFLSAQKLCEPQAMRSREVLTILKAEGWYELPRTGTSHVQLKHAERLGRVTVPHPKPELPIGTLKDIERSSGVKLRRR